MRSSYQKKYDRDLETLTLLYSSKLAEALRKIQTKVDNNLKYKTHQIITDKEKDYIHKKTQAAELKLKTWFETHREKIQDTFSRSKNKEREKQKNTTPHPESQSRSHSRSKSRSKSRSTSRSNPEDSVSPDALEAPPIAHASLHLQDVNNEPTHAKSQEAPSGNHAHHAEDTPESHAEDLPEDLPESHAESHAESPAESPASLQFHDVNSKPTHSKSQESTSDHGDTNQSSEDKILKSYKIIRKAIAGYCTGNKNALDSRSRKCIQDIFFRKGKYADRARWLLSTDKNICHLDENDYIKLKGQKLMDIDAKGRILPPDEGVDCSEHGAIETIGVRETTSAIVCAAIINTLPMARAGIAIISNPLSVIIPGFGSDSSHSMMILKSLLMMQTPWMMVPMMALDGVHLALNFLPSWESNSKCLDVRTDEAVPAWFRFIGGLLSSFLFGIMYGFCLCMLPGNTLGQISEFLSEKIGLVNFNFELDSFVAMTAIFAAISGTAGVVTVTLLHNALSRVVNTCVWILFSLGAIGEGGHWLWEFLRGYLDRVDNEKSDIVNYFAGVKDLMKNMTYNAWIETNPTDDDIDPKLKPIKSAITEATNVMYALLTPLSNQTPPQNKALRAYYSNIYGNYAQFLKSFSTHANAFYNGEGTVSQAMQYFTGTQSHYDLGAMLSQFRKELPITFAGHAFNAAFKVAVHSVGCTIAKKLYINSQDKKHIISSHK
jgi:hypothetical protein